MYIKMFPTMVACKIDSNNCKSGNNDIALIEDELKARIAL